MPLGLNIGLWMAAMGGGYVFENTEARDYVAAMAIKPDDDRKLAIDTYIGALKTAGVWVRLDILYLLAAHDSQAALLNLKAPSSFAGILVNAPAFEADRGFTGNGTSSRIRTQWAPGTNGVNFTQNSASMWVWSLTDAQSAGGDIGSNVTGAGVRLNVRNGSNLLLGRINDGTDTSNASAASVGFFGLSRPDASTKRLWKNGVQQGSDASVASTAFTADEQWICGANSGQFSARQIAVAAWADSLAGLESAFYTATLTYLQNLGAVP